MLSQGRKEKLYQWIVEADSWAYYRIRETQSGMNSILELSTLLREDGKAS
jgi:hypothetical protein